MKARQMKSPRTGKPVPGQFVITTSDKGTLFQSYDSPIAFIDSEGKVFLDEKKWDCSITTGWYRNLFLVEKKRETEKKIKSGEYTLTNLKQKVGI